MLLVKVETERFSCLVELVYKSDKRYGCHSYSILVQIFSTFWAWRCN